MILDRLAQSEIYLGLGPRFAAGLRWLADFQNDTPDGRIDIDGHDIYALVQSYDTAPSEEKKYEAHRIYADIQFIAAGCEVIHYAPTETLQAITAYDLAKDFSLYADPTIATPLQLNPGTFAIFYPQDGHKPCCSNGASCRIKKVVIKIRL